MKQVFIYMLLAMGVPAIVNSQTAEEAILISNTSAGGTARSAAVGGAFGSLGADISSLTINPAGLGLYRKSEISITPGISQVDVRSDFLGNRTNQIKYSININSAGLVFSGLRKDENGKPKTKGWVATNLAFGINRIANFNQQSTFAGVNADNSILDHYAESLNGTHANGLDYSNGFSPMLAYETFLLNPSLSDSSRYSNGINGSITQEGVVTSSGGIDEATVGLAGNYSNKVYFGGSIGIPLYHRQQDFTFRETTLVDSTNDLRSLEVNEELDANGAGINAKVGLVFRLGNWVRLGGAIHSPTYYFIEDRYNSTVDAEFDTIAFSAESPKGKYNYNLTTPWKVVGSASVILKKFGFLSFDYEMLDYSNAFYSYDSPFQLVAAETNKDIRSLGRTTTNLRFGAEIAWEILRFRGGYNMYGSPYKTGQVLGMGDGSKRSYSGGIGIRDKHFSLDIAVVRTETKEAFEPYPLENEEASFASNKTAQNQLLVTAGLRF